MAKKVRVSRKAGKQKSDVNTNDLDYQKTKKKNPKTDDDPHKIHL